jgi:molybdenum cofactor cytidylyltransferase
MSNNGAVILAAGESSRLGRPKPLIQFRGRTLLRRVVDAAGEAGCSPIIVVVGSDGKKLAPKLEQTSAIIVENENWRNGMGTSIRSGVRKLIDNSPELEAIVLLLCDQPFVDASMIKRLIARREESRKPIVASSYAATLGVPALFDRVCFEELLGLDDQGGAKPIILRNPERVAEISFPEGKIDIDTAADWEKLSANSDKIG